MYAPLVILCIFSIIGSALGVFCGFGMMNVATMSAANIREMLAMTGMASDDQLVELIMAFASMGPWMIAFNILELAGVVLMIRARWIGFHLYTAAQIGLAGLLVISVGFSGSIVSILWNATWVLIYFRLIKSAEAAANNGGDTPAPQA